MSPWSRAGASGLDQLSPDYVIGASDTLMPEQSIAFHRSPHTAHICRGLEAPTSEDVLPPRMVHAKTTRKSIPESDISVTLSYRTPGECPRIWLRPTRGRYRRGEGRLARVRASRVPIRC